MFRRVVLVVFALVATSVVTAAPCAAAFSYQRPIDAPVVDRFRAPVDRYAAGNRGWEFAPSSTTEVHAAAPGTVTFGGQVGGVLHVVVQHDDGVRTTYGKLTSIAVGISEGATVEAGQVLGSASSEFFFGARCGETYLDPARLFGVRVHLVDESATSMATGGSAFCAPPAGVILTDALQAWFADTGSASIKSPNALPVESRNTPRETESSASRGVFADLGVSAAVGAVGLVAAGAIPRWRKRNAGTSV